MLAEYWSNTGRILVKHLKGVAVHVRSAVHLLAAAAENTGQILVKYWSNTGQTLVENIGQVLVEHWSSACQILVKFFLILVKYWSKLAKHPSKAGQILI